MVGLADFPAARALRCGLRPEVITLSRQAVEPRFSSRHNDDHPFLDGRAGGIRTHDLPDGCSPFFEKVMEASKNKGFRLIVKMHD
jgi:hypothetical protein